MKSFNITFYFFAFFAIQSFGQTTILPFGFNIANGKFLEIEGNGFDKNNIQDNLFLKLNNTLNNSNSETTMEMGLNGTNSKTFLTQHSNIYYSSSSGSSFTNFGKLWSTGSGLILMAGSPSNTNGVLKFMTGGSLTEKMIINSSGLVGIGTNNPTSFLEIVGNQSAVSSGNDLRFFFKLKNTSNTNSSGAIMEISSGTNSSKTFLSHHSPTYYFADLIEDFADYGQVWSNGPGLILRAGGGGNTNGVLRFMTGDASGQSTEKMRMSNNGNLGLGTKTPNTKIQVNNGDIYIGTPFNGLIMKSPNGNCYKMTVNDNGTLSSTLISCP
jgi:hypothetical protein